MTTLKLKENGITIALESDIPQIAALCMCNIKDAGIPVSPCYEKIVWIVNNAILGDLCFVRRNKIDPRKVDGFLLLSHRIPEYSLDSIIYCLMFYIKPEFRTFSLAKNLLNSAKKYAIIVRQPLVSDLFNSKDATKKKKLLTYLGFEEIGSLYVFNPKTAMSKGIEDKTWDQQLAQ